MASLWLFLLILTTLAFTGCVESQSIQASMNPVPVGSNVTLTSSANVSMGGWLFNGSLLVLIYPGGFYLSKSRADRVTFNNKMSSLTIKSLTLNDSGEYKLEEMDVFSVSLQLSVQEPISNATLNAKRENLVEFNDTAVLTCSVATGTSLSYQWLAGNSTISSGTGGTRVELSNGGATISIFNLTHNDQGPYRCNVSNGVGYEESPPLNLNISYGPSNTTMTVMPVENVYRSGSKITLSCSTDSKPTATVWWMFNGTKLNNLDSQLVLQNVKENDTGTYNCVFYNIATKRFSNSSTDIRVQDPLTAVTVSHANGPAVLGWSFTLQCEVTGPVGGIQWWKNGNLIIPDSRTVFGMGNKTLTLNPVQQSDGGLYMCEAFNLVSNNASLNFTVVVNYGPEMPTIMGPNLVKSGSNVTFRCTAESVPAALYMWHFNGSLVSNMSEYTTPPLTKEMSGEYVCMALNNITGENNTASIMLTVVDPIRSAKVEPLSKPAMEGDSHNLTCKIIGPADFIYWMKDDVPLYSDNRTVFSTDNMTVMFTALNRSDNGLYKCLAISAVENKTSDAYMLLVTYGPMMQHVMGPNRTLTGDNATLRCWAESVPASLYEWYFNGTLISNMSEYKITALTEDMGGMYTCVALNNITGKNSTVSLMLTVVGPIKNVQIKTPRSHALENQSYELTCIVTGIADHIDWMKNGEKLLPGNNTVFSMDKKTVTFNRVDRYDAGNYTSMAINPLGNLNSTAYMLQVNYGPDKPNISGPDFGEMGRNAVFHCSASSMPASTYTWWFNDSLVANSSQFIAGPLSFNMSGNYTCMAHNDVTGKNSTLSTTLTVIEAIESVMIHGNTTPINNANLTLTCHIVGPYDTIYWMKDDMQLNMNNSVRNSSMYIIENNRLHFTPLTLQSNGTYQCVAVNRAAQHKSPQFPLLVNYGPLSVSISGPATGKNGTFVSLKCTADSYPECNFQWLLNIQVKPVWDGAGFTFLATKGNTGNFTCIARNPVTNITMSQSKAFAIVDHATANCIPNKGALLLMGVCALLTHLLFL